MVTGGTTPLFLKPGIRRCEWLASRHSCHFIQEERYPLTIKYKP